MENVLNNQTFMIVFDLDGTLLNSKKDIEPKTKKLLQKLASLGNVITIASGRPPRSIVEYTEDLGIRLPFIGYNGSIITNPYDRSFKTLKRKIKKEVILDFLSHFGEDSISNIMIEDETEQYYLKENELYTFFFHPEGMNLHIGSVLKNLDRDVLTCVIEAKDTSRNEEFKEYLNLHQENMSIRFWYDSPRFGEFFFYDSNKSTSINRLADYYHIDRAHIICFGDAMNDLQMLKNAGVSFAMRNGVPPLKEASTYITEYDNDHEGIYYSLLKFFNLDEDFID